MQLKVIFIAATQYLACQCLMMLNSTNKEKVLQVQVLNVTV